MLSTFNSGGPWTSQSISCCTEQTISSRIYSCADEAVEPAGDGIDTLSGSIVRVVDLYARHAFWVIAVIVVFAAGSAVYATAIKTNVTDLFPQDLPWTRRALDFMKAFPQPDILVVIDAPIPNS